MTQQEIENIIKTAAGWEGYLEKAQPFYTHYESKTTAAGSGNFTRFGRIADLVIGGACPRGWCGLTAHSATCSPDASTFSRHAPRWARPL